jgi:hypothetical protein
VENASIDYGGVVIACTTEGVYALENYKNNTLLQRTIQVNGKIKLKKMHMVMTYSRLIKRIVHGSQNVLIVLAWIGGC